MIAYAQDPQFNVANLGPHIVDPEPAATVWEPAPTAGGNVLIEDAMWAPADLSAPVVQDTKRVSVVFENASPDQVVKWLVRQGFNLVIPNDQISKDRKISLSFKNAPAEEALDAIARALGGVWERKGEVRTFRKGMTFLRDLPLVAPRSGGPAGAHIYRFDSKELTPEQKAKFEAMGKDLAEMGVKMAEKFGPEFQKSLELRLKDMPRMVVPPVPPLPPLDSKGKLQNEEAYAKAMEAWAKSWEAKSKDWEAWGEKLEKEMELKFGKDFEKDFGDKLQKEFEQKWGKDGEKLRIEIERHMKDAEKAGGDVRVFRLGPTAPGAPIAPGLRSTDIRQLAKTLTPEQKELHKKQGFLRKKDLSPEQIKLLGSLPTAGKWSIQYSVEDESLTIKSDE